MKDEELVIVAVVGLGAFWLFGGFTWLASLATPATTTATSTTNLGTTTNAASVAGTKTNVAPAKVASIPGLTNTVVKSGIAPPKVTSINTNAFGVY
jgi:hypothetical protein